MLRIRPAEMGAAQIMSLEAAVLAAAVASAGNVTAPEEIKDTDIGIKYAGLVPVTVSVTSVMAKATVIDPTINTKRRYKLLNTETVKDNVRIIQDNKVAIPDEVQKILGVANGYRVMFIADGEEVRIVNPAVHSMRKLQEAMKGAAEEAGWKSDDDVVE